MSSSKNRVSTEVSTTSTMDTLTKPETDLPGAGYWNGIATTTCNTLLNADSYSSSVPAAQALNCS